MAILPKLMNTIPIKVPKAFFTEMDTMISKFIRNYKRPPPKKKKILKRNKGKSTISFVSFIGELFFSPKEMVGKFLFVLSCFDLVLNPHFQKLRESKEDVFFCIITKPNYYFMKLNIRDILVICIKMIRKNKHTPNNFPIFTVLLKYYVVWLNYTITHISCTKCYFNSDDSRKYSDFF